jgi:hypothetical protein
MRKLESFAELDLEEAARDLGAPAWTAERRRARLF